MAGRLWIAASLLMVPSIAAAQTATVEQLASKLDQLAQRVDSLERENAQLKARLAQSGSAPQAQSATFAPVAAATGPAAAPPATTASAVAARSRGDWSGPYLGVHAGIARSHYRTVSAQPLIIDAEGAAFGAQLGWRWQSGALVTGAELELTLPRNQAGRFAPTSVFETSTTGRIKGQVGVSDGPFLIYGTGGIQLSNVGFYDANIGQSGFVYGAGVAWRVSPRISLGVEGVQADLGFIPNVAAVTNRGRSLTVRLNYVP